ncbi:hypothetical protein TSAR_012800 [Trichomalopsis sarcophagae]|uniref:Uncharacterized protein n=1 Tax=Trichomalopsis sarcophagae TaxID=543379 RepID=A0A232EGB4_9HYME|nr:hypothetical protein TSAR_012800 [Trichomalopsis sarcophagae]
MFLLNLTKYVEYSTDYIIEAVQIPLESKGKKKKLLFLGDFTGLAGTTNRYIGSCRGCFSLSSPISTSVSEIIGELAATKENLFGVPVRLLDLFLSSLFPAALLFLELLDRGNGAIVKTSSSTFHSTFFSDALIKRLERGQVALEKSKKSFGLMISKAKMLRKQQHIQKEDKTHH